MEYKDHLILAEECTFNLLRVNEDGDITDEIYRADYEYQEPTFAVADLDGRVIDNDVGGFEEAKDYIDRIIERQQAQCSHGNMISSILTDEHVCTDCGVRRRA